MQLRELAALVALAAVWGGSYLFIRVAVPELGPFPLMAARVLLAAAILALLPKMRQHWRALRHHAAPLLVLGAVNAAAPYALIAGAELRLTASLAAILGATIPLFSAVMGALWLKEPMGPRQVGGLLLGMGGVVVLVGWSPVPVSGRMVLDAAAVLAASVCYAYAGIYAKRRLAELPAAALALGQQLGAAAWLVVPAVLTAPAAMPSSRAMLALAALATVSTAFAYLLYFFLIARIGPTRTPTVAYLIPVFGLLWGVLFLGESITAGMMVGMGCILVSMVLVNGVPVSGLRWQARSSAMGVVRRTDAG